MNFLPHSPAKTESLKIYGLDPGVEDEIYCNPHRYHCWLRFVGMTIHLNARGTWFDSIGRNAPGAFCVRFNLMRSVADTQ
jgi:hypothetical protein